MHEAATCSKSNCLKHQCRYSVRAICGWPYVTIKYKGALKSAAIFLTTSSFIL